MTQTTPSHFFASGYASPEQAGIFCFRFNEDSGEITPHGSFAGINAPSFLVTHPNHHWLYAVSETGRASHGALGEVWSFSFEVGPFSIQQINHRSSRGDWPCHLQLDNTTRWLVTTNYGTGNAGLYPIQSDGSLGEMTDFVQHQGKGPNAERQEGPHAHSSIFTPDNLYLIVADLGTDQLIIYQLDDSKGKLAKHSTINTAPGTGPRHLVFHSNGKWMYAANELSSTVTLYAYNSAKGLLMEQQSLSSLPMGSFENIVADIHVSGSGARLYVSNRGHNSIAVYDIGADGVLTLNFISDCGGNWPRNFALAPGGKFVLVANQYSNELCVLPITEGTHALGTPVTKVPLAGASCIRFV